MPNTKNPSCLRCYRYKLPRNRCYGVEENTAETTGDMHCEITAEAYHLENKEKYERFIVDDYINDEISRKEANKLIKELYREEVKTVISDIKIQNQKDTMRREQVYKLIDSERHYQENLPYYSAEQDSKHSVASWIIAMEKHLANAKEEIYKLDDIAALEEVRKVVAIGVACMENNDTPERHLELE